VPIHSVVTHPVKGIPASKTPARKAVIQSAARDPEFPIFLSYTESEMAQKLGEIKPYSESMFYVTTTKQAVGIFSVKNIINQED